MDARSPLGRILVPELSIPGRKPRAPSLLSPKDGGPDLAWPLLDDAGAVHELRRRLRMTPRAQSSVMPKWLPAPSSRFGPALYFTGAQYGGDAYSPSVSIPSGVGITLSVWFYRPAAWNLAATYYRGLLGWGDRYGNELLNVNTYERAADSSLRIEANLRSGGNSTFGYFRTTSSTLYTYAWTHMLAAWTPNASGAYDTAPLLAINGIAASLSGSNTLATAGPAGSAVWRLGRVNDGSGTATSYAWLGWLADARVYWRALSAAEGTAIYRDPYGTLFEPALPAAFAPPSGGTVTADRDLSWDLLVAAVADRALAWHIATAVHTDAQLAWDLLVGATADRAIAWNLLASLTRDLSCAWSIRESVASEASLSWDLLAAVAADRELSWDLLSALGTVIADRALSWNLQAVASADRALAWHLLAAVERALEARWDLLVALQVERTVAWNCAAAIATELSLAWRLLARCEADFPLTWELLEIAETSVTLTWRIGEETFIPVVLLKVPYERRRLAVPAEIRRLRVH